jgi:hypothetical protein
VYEYTHILVNLNSISSVSKQPIQPFLCITVPANRPTSPPPAHQSLIGIAHRLTGRPQGASLVALDPSPLAAPLLRFVSARTGARTHPHDGSPASPPRDAIRWPSSGGAERRRSSEAVGAWPPGRLHGSAVAQVVIQGSMRSGRQEPGGAPRPCPALPRAQAASREALAGRIPDPPIRKDG